MWSDDGLGSIENNRTISFSKSIQPTLLVGIRVGIANLALAALRSLTLKLIY